MVKDFIDTNEFTREQLVDMIELSLAIKRAIRSGYYPPLMQDMTLGMIFQQSSTRTRVSFETAMSQMGGHAQYLGPGMIQLGGHETIGDTGKVLSRLVDVVMARVIEHRTVVELAQSCTVPVLNGMSDYNHPTQEIGDMCTIFEHLPQGKRLKDVKVVFVGDGTQVCASLGFITTKLGMHFVAMGPEELAKQMDQEVVQSTFAEARKNGGLIEITDHAEDLKGADVIYGDVWASMGEEAQIPERVGLLSPFRVTMDTLKATENPDVLYLHCLPSFHDFETKMAKEWQAKGVDIREVTDEVFRSRHSVVFDEAENRMHSIKAVMVATIGA